MILSASSRHSLNRFAFPNSCERKASNSHVRAVSPAHASSALPSKASSFSVWRRSFVAGVALTSSRSMSPKNFASST